MTRPTTQVDNIELLPRGPAHAQKIVPLPLRGFTPGTIPFQLSEDRIFRRRYGALDWFSFVRTDLPKYAPSEFCPAEFVSPEGKQIEFPSAPQMDQIRGAVPRECFADQRGIRIKILAKFRRQIVDLIWFEIDHEIDIQRRPGDAVGGTGDRSPYGVADLQPVQNLEQTSKGLRGRGHLFPNLARDPSHRRES